MSKRIRYRWKGCNIYLGPVEMEEPHKSLRDATHQLITTGYESGQLTAEHAEALAKTIMGLIRTRKHSSGAAYIFALNTVQRVTEHIDPDFDMQVARYLDKVSPEVANTWRL